MSFKLGCAIWAYKAWVGELFPVGSQAANFLRLYSRRFSTVEGNTTFYSIPDAATVERWASETPSGFEFCLKLPRDLTHRGALTPAIPGTIAFIEKMQPLGDRLGPFFAQLPPSYSPEQLEDLKTFLMSLPLRDMALAVEVRHLGWFREPHATRLNDVLTELGVGRVLLDTRPIYECPDDPQLESERRKPKVPLQPIVTADFSLIRYISHPERSMNESYFQDWVNPLNTWLQQGKRIYFFVHCPVEERSPGNARHFQARLEAQGVPVPPLPWNELDQPSQLSLF